MSKTISSLSYLFHTLAALFFLTASHAQTPPQTYVAPKAIDSIIVDGVADETSWEEAFWTADFIDIEGKKTPKYQTRMKMLWDDDHLYFYVEMEEPHVWGTLKQRDTVIFYNNDFEVFIDPDGDTHNYMEFEMNALNTVWDLWLTKPYRNGPKVIDGWDIQGLRTAVQVKGTLNDPNDIDQGWTVEIAMPWPALLEAADRADVPANAFWRVNFSRVNWDFDLVDGRYSRKKDKDGTFLPEYNWVWSPQGVINMHEPEHWGYVYFSEDAQDGFEIPKDEHLKWYLYEMGRRLWRIEKENGRSQDRNIDAILEPKEFFGQTVAPGYKDHRAGWNLWIDSPFSDKKLMLREDGLLTMIER